jgi:hypothetical protein
MTLCKESHDAHVGGLKAISATGIVKAFLKVAAVLVNQDGPISPV